MDERVWGGRMNKNEVAYKLTELYLNKIRASIKDRKHITEIYNEIFDNIKTKEEVKNE